MANSDKNILITPFVGGITQPQIAFVGQGNDPIYLRVLDGVTGTGATAGGALSVEGSAGQLFSIVNRLGTGSIFSVNDISGIPSIDVDANGTIVFAGFTGNVGIGVTAPTNKLSVAGNISATGTVTGSRLVYALNGLTGGVTLIAGANITLTSSAAGITIASTASGSGDNVVTSFNGRTGAVQGVSAAVAGIGISVSGATGAVTITNIGVQSFNGLTGVVGGVTTSAANTFSAKQTFSLGIEVSNGATFSTPVNVAHNITQTGNTRGISAEGFLYVGLGATFGTSVATNRIVNGVAGATLTVTTSTSGNLNIIPVGSVFMAPTPLVATGGDSPRVTVQGTDNAAGQVLISGGDLYLGSKTNALASSTPCVVLFANPSNAFTTTVQASTTTSNKTITLPDASGTVALTDSVVTSFNGLTGAVVGVTLGGVNTFTRTNTFNQGICAAAGFTLSSGRINFTSASVSISPFTLNAASLSDGVGAIRINSSEPDINLNDTDGGFSTFTFENNSVARVALGRNSVDGFYLAVRDPSVSGGAWKDAVIVADSSTGNVGMNHNLGVTGSISAQSLTGTSVARAWFM